MKKTFLSILSACLAILMLGAILCTSLASCTKEEETTTTTKAPSESDKATTESSSVTKEETTESSAEPDIDNTVESSVNVNTEEESSAETDSDTVTSKDSETESKDEVDTEETTEEFVGPILEDNVYSPSIEYAQQMANGVQSYYTTASRDDYRIENLNMNLNYSLTGSKKVTSITNKQGGVYVQDTMDVFVTKENGERFYASASANKIRPNIYRIGYYYYDVHMLENDFAGETNIYNSLDLDPKIFSIQSNGISNYKVNKDEVTIKIGGGDPYICMAGGDNKFTFAATDYNAIQLSIKSDSVDEVQIYYIAGTQTDHTNSASVKASVSDDGEYHTYTIMLSKGAGYTDTVSRIRIDFDGAKEGDTVKLKDLKLVNAEVQGFDGLFLDRTYHTYSDKLHQALHFVASQQVTGIKELGMITEIAVDTVDKLIVKDAASELHTTLDGVDWATAEYVGFDIKGVGIFGYILPVDENAGKITVEIVDGYYVITQTVTPKIEVGVDDEGNPIYEYGIINPMAVDDPTTGNNEAKDVNTSNDFFTGNRIYTDANHDFDAFIAEAEFERFPLENISSNAFLEYDSITGAYEFSINGTGFNGPFFYDNNYHYNINIKARNRTVDRAIYIRTITSSGCLESAAILSDKNLVLPILTEVSKNFGGENEEPLFNCGDMTYGETLFPIVLPADEKVEFNVLNLYQNWGTVPLKQLSSIQYFWPYYHLSVGTTETSCISPWYGATDLWTLPDFRSQSMPYWFELPADKGYSNQPQHTHAGYQYFLQYTDADGIYNATENISNVIDSAGPVYVDVDMTYISDDGKIKVTYTHVEMPQEDELRAYYEINYEILEEVKIKDFANDFSFYSFEGYSGYYRKMGYWAEQGDQDGIVYKDTNGTQDTEKLVLGNDSPYVALYDLKASGSWEFNNANMGFVIHSSNIVIDGVERNDNFVVMGKNYVYSLSMDLGEVTLKPGDTINLNMVITPWGHYDTTEDTSMQNIRENTCLNPLTVEVSNGEKIESVFVPKILSTDGKSAEFTLSGGTDNVVARVYGFNKLTNPKIYEKVDGEWVEYVVSSINTPDKMGNKHYYDGYYVYYDGNGTFSYAFAADMTDYESRTFKIVAEEEFTRWPNIINTGKDSPLNVYVSSGTLFALTNGAVKGIGKTELADDASYVRYYGDGLGTGEAYFTVFTNSDDRETGAYVVLKYRIPTSNPENNYFQFFTTTDPDVEMPQCSLNAGTAYKNGEWHVMVVDVNAMGHKHFLDTGDGETYKAQYLRLDVFNVPMSAESYIDIAYIGITDDISKVFELEKLQDEKCEEVRVFSAGGAFTAYDLDNNIIENPKDNTNTTTPTNKDYIDPDNEQGYTKSETPYISGIDFINGLGDGEANNPAYNSFISHQNIGPKVVDFDGGTVGNAYLVLTGWTCVYEGIEKYVWSADGGKTWHNAVIYNRNELAAASGGVKTTSDNHFKASGIEGFDAATYNQDYYANSGYQGSYGNPSGVAAHLTDYIGQEVDITFAVVPKNAPTTLCLIGHVQKVRVYESDDAAAEGEKCKHTTASSGYTFVDDGDGSTDSAMITKSCKCGEVTFETAIPQYVLLFDKIGETATAPLVCENAKNFVTVDSKSFIVSGNTKSFTADANGTLYLKGWTGVNGGLNDVVYKVYDAEGNELTSGWQNTNSTLTVRSDIAGEMTKRGIETAYGRGFDATLDLSDYFAQSSTLKIVLALECSGAPEGSNDKYVYLCELLNVAKAS